MADYLAVSDALARGVDPTLICETCPWDRNCINPPTMTRAEVEAKRLESTAGIDEEGANGLAKALMTAVLFAGTQLREELMVLLVANGYSASATEYRPGHWRINVAKKAQVSFRKDTQSEVCPVLAVRLRTSDGRKINDLIKACMIEDKVEV